MLKPSDKLLIVGYTGRLGKTLYQYLTNNHACQVFGHNRHTDLNTSIQHIQPTLIVDLTSASVIERHIQVYRQHSIRTLIGTSGITPKNAHQLILKQNFPLMLVINFSKGIGNLINQAKALGTPTQIHEVHSLHKVDSPSTTALYLQEILNKDAVITSSRIPKKIASHTLIIDEKELTHSVQDHNAYLDGIIECLITLKQCSGPLVLVSPPDHEWQPR